MSRVIDTNALGEASRQALAWQFGVLLRRAQQLRASEATVARLKRAVVSIARREVVRIERRMPRAPKPQSTGMPTKVDWKRVQGDMHGKAPSPEPSYARFARSAN